MISFKKNTPLHPLIHIMAWILLFGYPFLLTGKGDHHFTWESYLVKCIIPLSFMIVFYTNYFFLIDKFLFTKKIKHFIISNIILITIVGLLVRFGFEYCNKFMDILPPPRRSDEKNLFMEVLHTSRNIFSLIISAAMSIAIRMTFRWKQTEEERKDLEKSKTEAELKNLKNQLNPHFLLNTLNNIYALISFSPERAQQAVQELSKLLRYVLYDNNLNYVLLKDETDFIKNYIELMRIRLPESIRLDIRFNIEKHSNSYIAPLLFISLIENAFKHGVSYTHPSYILIELTEDSQTQKISCKVENSYFPKKENDKSGSGIGLEHLKRRLELLYAGHYEWKIEQTDQYYRSVLTIDLNKQEKN